MLTVDFNPPQVEREYLDALNACFGHWGDEKLFHWVFRRDLSFLPADLMVLRDETGELLAGSGISYRQLLLPNGNTMPIGIMTGSWTLPAARNQGCFTRIIQESLSKCRQHEIAMLIAFVTSDNASMRRLAAAGAGLVSAFYLFTTPETLHPGGGSLATLEPNASTIARLRALLAEMGRNRACFAYPAARDFVSQLIQRPQPTTLVADADGNIAVIETMSDTDRVQALAYAVEDRENIRRFLTSLLARALDTKRKLFLYTTNSTVLEAARSLNIADKTGYITLLAAHVERLQAATECPTPWCAADSTVLAVPDNEWFMGDWQVHSGDRA